MGPDVEHYGDTEQTAQTSRVGVDADVIRCEITQEELQKTPLTDDFAIPRLLVSKAFIADGGPLQPKLRGQIGYTIDFETGNYRFFQHGV
jgi:hypothetical protein